MIRFGSLEVTLVAQEKRKKDDIMILFVATGLTDNCTTSTTVHNRVLFSSLQIQQFNQ